MKSINEVEYLATGSKNFLKLNSFFLFIKRSLVAVISNISQNQSLLRYGKDATLHRRNLFHENEMLITREKLTLTIHISTTQAITRCTLSEERQTP